MEIPPEVAAAEPEVAAAEPEVATAVAPETEEALILPFFKILVRLLADRLGVDGGVSSVFCCFKSFGRRTRPSSNEIADERSMVLESVDERRCMSEKGNESAVFWEVVCFFGRGNFLSFVLE